LYHWIALRWVSNYTAMQLEWGGIFRVGNIVTFSVTIVILAIVKFRFPHVCSPPKLFLAKHGQKPHRHGPALPAGGSGHVTRDDLK
jgi:hypothetical protein